MHEPAAAGLRIVVADDQDIVREGLVTVLGLVEGITVVAQAGNGAEAVAAVAKTQPDAVLMDLRMPVLDGAEATAQIMAQSPETAVLVLTTFDDDASIAKALQAGARGYLTKGSSRDELVAALQLVSRGQAAFDSSVAARLVAGFQTQGHPAPPEPAVSPRPAGWEQLTRREKQVLELIGQGLSNTEIATELFVSQATVKTHINNLFTKLGLRDRAQAIRLALSTE